MASRRHEESNHNMISKLNAALERLRSVWDEIGLDSTQQSARTDAVFVHLNNLLEEMVAEEEGLRDRLLKSIKKYGIELLRLSKELGVPPYEPPEGLTNIQLEKDLKMKVKSWEKERRERVALLSKLQEEEQHLCDVLCATPLYITSGSVPKQEQLDELQNHIRSLRSEKEKRQKLFVSTKKNILKMLEDLEQCPDTSFERDLLCEDDDSFLLSNDNMAALKKYADELETQQKENFALASRLRDQLEMLWERLQISPEERMQFRTRTAGFKPKVIEEIRQEIARCQELKRDKIQQVIECVRRELVEWWDKCYVDQEERDKFRPFTDDSYTETCLTQHEQEVERWKQYYEKNKEMLELVGKWQKLFNKFLEDEEKAADPNRYLNRGCNLLKEEKARKKIQKELPRVEQEVTARISEWEQSAGQRFLMNGKPFVEYIEECWENYKLAKERKKAERLQAKARLMEEELKYGSRPAHTPGKKRPLGQTPGKTPTKRCRINETTKTPTSYATGASRLIRTNHTSVFSPVCMTPRSTNKAAGGAQAAEAAGDHLGRRFVLAEKNPPPPPPPAAVTPRPTSSSQNETGFSQTTVSSAVESGPGKRHPEKDDVLDEASLDSVGPYQEFARGLSQNSRPNCRSSVLPSSLKPAYF